MSDQPPDDSSTVCPRCGVGCRLRSRADNASARGVAGAANPNGRLCQSGIGAFDSPDDRLTTPLIRRGSDLEPVSWASAYERVVTSFESIVDAHGPDSLAFLGAPRCSNEENYLLQKLARMLGTNNVDTRARLCHASTARVLSDRLGWPATTNSLADLSDADVIIVAGANPAERQPVAFNSFVRPAVNAGTTLVHVDPIGNRTTRLADIHVTPRPGMDALVFDLLSAKLLDGETGVDRTFVETRTQGFDQFAASISDIDVDETLLAAGVAAESVESVADSLTDADRAAALVGTGIESGPSETNASAALLNVLLLTGNLGRQGTGVYVLRGLVNEQGATDAGCVPDRLPGHQPVTDATARARIESEWGIAPPSAPGKSATELLSSFGNDVHGVLVVGENPAISKRDPDRVRHHLDSLETLVVVDLVSNETSTYADVVLPASAGTEKAGTVTNVERRVQRIQQMSDPPGKARTDFTILTELGRRLVDRSCEFAYSDPSDVFDELTRVAPTHENLSDSELGTSGQQWPGDDDGVLYRTKFETGDGRARFGSAQPLVASDAEDGLWLVTGGRKRESSADEPPADCLLRINSADAREKGIADGETVVVSDGETAMQATAALDDGVRQGAVYLPATVADPFLRQGTNTVSVTPYSAQTEASRN